MPGWIRCALWGLFVGVLLIFGHALFSVGAFAAPPGLPSGCVDTTEALAELHDIPDHPTALNAPGLIVVRKGARRLMLFDKGKLHRGASGVPACWRAALALAYPAGHKQREGDRKTPEGWYRTSDKPTSQFYGAIAVHYPNTQDADAGLARGQISKARRDAIAGAIERGVKPPQSSPLGGEILVHGGGNFPDWTLGCVALENAELDRLRGLLPAGMKTDILILP